jgi:hypothetical protein
MAVGVGGLIAGLINPNMNDKIAAAITPQLPGGAPPPAGGALPGQGGAPAAAPAAAPAPGYAPDPVVMQNNAKTLLQAQQMEDLAADFNYNMRVISSGFGTAQQQASKMAALNGGPGATDLLGQLGQIQGIQKSTFQQQQENLALAAMMDHKFLNQTAATTGLTPQQIKTFLLGGGKIGDLFAGQIGSGGDPVQQDMRRDRTTWIQQHQAKDKNGEPIPGKYVDDQGQPVTMPSDLVNSQDYVLRKQERAQKQKDVVATQGNFAGSVQSYDKQLADLNELLDPDNRKYLDAFIGAGLGGGLSREYPTLIKDPKAQELYQKFNTVMAGQFAAGVQDFPGSRISTKELLTDAPSKSSMKPQQGVDSWVRAGEQYRQQLLEHRTNLFGKAQQLDHSKLTDAEYDKYLDPIYKEGGDYGPERGAVHRAPPAQVKTPQDVLALPPGKAFVMPDGTKGYAVHTQNDIALLPHGAAFIIPAGPHAGEIDHAP